MAFGTHSFTADGVVLTPADERRFFGSLELGNGVRKITRARRLDDVNAFVAAAWKDLGFRPRIVMDAGASSGVSSREWADALADEGFDARVVASDVSLYGKLVGVLPKMGLLVASDGTPLHHIVFGRFLFRERRWVELVTGRALVRAVIDRVAKLRYRNLAGGGRPIILVNAEALAHSRVDFVEDDLLAPAPPELAHRFDAIRVANVLNLSYFRLEDLKRGLSGLRQRLAGVGSFLIVVRTWAGGANHGTLFRLNENGRFDVVARLGAGSEIENLVLKAVG